MIDNETEVQELIKLLNEHAPMRAYATSPLVNAVRQAGASINVNDPVQIDSVLYLGDEGGIACAIEVSGGRSVVVTSLTHLRIDRGHPLARQIEAYQLDRTKRLRNPAGHNTRSSGAPVAKKRERQTVHIDHDGRREENDLNPGFQTARRSWTSGEYRRAADAFRDVLQLDHNDPQFSRYWLASCLFLLGSPNELDELLRQHDDNSGVWRFAQALQSFHLHGDTGDARRMLVEAGHLEPGFENYLLRDQVADARREVRFDADPAARAFGCARLFLPAWRGIPGAAAWARRVLKVPPTGVGPDDAPRRFPEDELRALPARRETWQVGLIRCDDDRRDGTPSHDAAMWTFGVVNVSGQEIRAVTVIDRALTEVVAWNHLIQSFLSPMDGDPARPGTLVVCRREFHEAWKPLLSKIGVRCRFENYPQPVGRLLQAMGNVVKQPAPPDAEDIDILDFPQSEAVWQADFIRSPAWVMNEQEGSYRPWCVLVLDKSRSKALLTSLTPADPAPEMLLDFLVRAMARPQGESAQRPRLIEVSDSDCYDHLRPRLEAAGIACRLVDELGEFNDFCLKLARSVDGSEKCALAAGQAVTRAHMEAFYEAAAHYFQAAPWRRVPGEVPIEIRCDDPAIGTRYAIVLGRTGVQLGLCIYDNREIMQAQLGGYATADEMRALAVCYDEAEIMAAVDLQLIDRLGWPIAAPEAWPAVMRLMPRRTPRSANADELVFLAACLRAIPDFLTMKTASRTLRVETGSRQVELHLAWKD